MRLLSVEDDAGIGRFVRQGLVEADYEVDWEREGTRGLERAVAAVHDLVILDILLPDLDGLEALSRIRAAEMGLCEVADEGPGVAPEDLPRIFEPFYQGAGSRSQEGQGSGLGLAIAREIAGAHVHYSSGDGAVTGRR